MATKNRGFWAAWPQMGVPIGLILSTWIVALFSSQSNFESFGWRIPFFISALLIVIGLFIRLRIFETPLFAQVKAAGRESAAPVAEAFRRNWVEIILSAGARFVEQAPFYLFTIPLFGYLSDRVGRRMWYLVGCVIMMAFAFPYFALLNTKDPLLVTLAVVISLALGHAWVYGPQAALIAERFGTRSRYSGASLGYQLAAPFAGGFAPIIALLLLTGKSSLGALGLKGVIIIIINIGKGSWQAVAVYIIVLGVISFVSVLGLKELSHADISDAEKVVVIPAVVPD
jgi:MFS family permease